MDLIFLCQKMQKIPSKSEKKITMSASLYWSSFVYVFCSTVWCLPTCMKYARQCDVCPPVWCLPIWCRPSCMISSYPYDVCPTVSCLPTCLMFVQLDNVWLRGWCLLYCTVWCLPIFTYDVCLSVWCLPIFMMSAYLYDCFLTVWCPPILNNGYRINPISTKYTSD